MRPSIMIEPELTSSSGIEPVVKSREKDLRAKQAMKKVSITEAKNRLSALIESQERLARPDCRSWSSRCPPRTADEPRRE
jgi:hypothetical protein